MRKLKLQMNMTIDGFVANPEGQLDWMLQEVDERHIDFLQALTDSIDMILMGRKMADESIPYWENVAESQSDNPEFEYARFFVKTPKVIFSKTLSHFKSKNTDLENGDLRESILKLKSQPGKDIIVYGGAGFVSSLIEQNLIDELNLFVHPTAIGSGLPIFKSRLNYELTKSDFYSNGIVLKQYKPAM